MKIFKSATLIVASLLLMAGFQSCSNIKPIAKEDLKGHWILKTIEGEKVADIHSGAKPTLEFDFEESRIAGSSGCNTYGGGFTLTDANEFKADKNMISTMMLCPDMKMEDRFTKAIQKEGLVLEINPEGKLSFKEGTKDVLVFKKGEKQVPYEAVNTENIQGEWKLVKLSDKNLDETFGERVPTMSVNEEGKVAGFAGCNRFMASYKIEEGNLSFEHAPAMTRMACENLEGESMFVEALSQVEQGSINFDKLVLTKGGVILLEFAKVEEAE